MENSITKAQLQIIHTLLSKRGMMANKTDLVYSFTGGRTESSRRMTLREAKRFIQYLKDGNESESIIKRIFHLGYLSGIIYGDTPEDKAMNTAKLNTFCEERGTVKKVLYKQTISELKRTVKQFEAIVKKVQEKKYLNEYIAYVQFKNELLIKDEEYEKVNQNLARIELAKKNPVVTAIFMRNLEKQYTEQ